MRTVVVGGDTEMEVVTQITRTRIWRNLIKEGYADTEDQREVGKQTGGAGAVWGETIKSMG